ncbi:uncharacterized protein [Argopecten irradians]|uniref:uncharacterized protein n=1 Tax=Argopecten irradians TaxID=31199 RepID=UPI003716EA56
MESLEEVPDLSESDESTYPKVKYLKQPLEVSAFQYTTVGSVFAIHPRIDGTAIINGFRYKELSLVDKAGSVQRRDKINFTTLGFTSLSTGGKLLTNFHEKCIMTLTDSGETQVAFSTSPLFPVQICETQERCLLVTLTDSEEYNINDDNTRVLTKYTNRGLRMLTVERDRKGQRLFCRPGRLKYNKQNGQIIVGSRTGETSAHLVVFDADLRLLFRYLGNGRTLSSDDDYTEHSRNKEFFTVDSDFDIWNNIVVADSNSKSVELLDCEGKLLKTVIQDSNVPRSICVNFDQTLWVGFTNGHVKVFKYMNQEDTEIPVGSI